MRPRDLETLELPRVLEAIAGFARSESGRDAVHALRPTTDRAVADDRLDVAAELLALTAEAGAMPTADVPRLGPALTQAAPVGAALEGRWLMEVRDLLVVARHVRTWLRRDPDRLPRLATLADGLPEVPELEEALLSTLDDSGQVREDASPALAAARRATRELRTRLEADLMTVVRDPQHEGIMGDQYVTVRNGRYVVPIRTAAAWTFNGVVQDRSASDETVFVEPLFAIEQNNRLLLASKTEEAEERRVRAELTAAVRTHTEPLRALEEALAEADALAAVAAFAHRHACTRPVLGTDDVVLPAARHPLLVLSGREVTPVDIRLRAGQRGLAITGPNAGGKTVTLKTLGLMALMAQAGIFIPAGEGSRLPCFTAILADIGDEQSIERDLSTFTGHAENLGRIANAVTPGSLVLLDEPGAGTDPVEGAALATGVLADLLARGPIIVFTTHFPQVKTFSLAEPELEVAAFDVDPVSGAPRYRLDYHTIGQSFALPIARRHGIPARALETAERLLAGESQDLSRAIARLETSRRELETAREAAETEAARLAAERATVETLADDLRQRRRQRWADDLEASRRFVRDLETQGRAVLDELRRTPDPTALRRFVTEAKEGIAAHTADAAPDAPPPGRPPRVGDTVEVTGRGIRGELLELTGDRARLQRGGLKFEVPSNQLRVVTGAPTTKERTTGHQVTSAESDSSAIELNVIGQRARDAVAALGPFLDRAIRTGASEVRVVHGLGSGALRRAVQDFLASSPYCAKYRDADPQNGGAAVTVAELN
ncbi:MAG TPA: Smr/MutS family protein [Candidatus Binatia bacterium]|nr:Smr/MutS family protein [Candidatus Binatia bacterium]